MKAKPCIACGVAIAALLLASLVVLPSSGGSDDGAMDVQKKGADFIAAQIRPSGVEEKDWIPISDRAGYAISRYVSVTVIEAKLYLKTERGWIEAHIVNPATPQMLGR